MRSQLFTISLTATFTFAFALGSQARAQVTPDEVLVVVNDGSAISTAIGDYYATVRSIPGVNVLHLAASTPTGQTISRTSYETQVRDPIAQYLTVTQPQLQSQIKFIVLTKDVPLRVSNTSGSGLNIDAASVDSELTQLFTGQVPDGGHQGRLANPFLGNYRTPEDFLPLSGCSYLVFRLDGYADTIDPVTGVPDTIKRFIDEAQSPAASGQVLLDAQTSGQQGDDWMVEASAVLTEMGIPHILNTNGNFRKNVPDLLGYCSWGSNDPDSPAAPYYGEIPPGSGDVYPGTLLPGCITTTYVSSSARTFDWPPTYGQSLIADLMRLGAGGCNGHVFEPFLDAVSQPQYLFPRYFQGWQLGTALYWSIPYLSWENVVVCDPLQVMPAPTPMPPQVDSLSQGRAPAGMPLIDFMLIGEYLTNRRDITVRLGGLDCMRYRVRNTTIALCDTPALPAGLLDLEVTTTMGTLLLTDRFISYPAMNLTGTVDLGQPITLSIYGTRGDLFLTFLSLGTGLFPFPPFGDLLLDPSQGFFLVLTGNIPVSHRRDINTVIPNDPTLSGVTVYMQSLVGADSSIGDGMLSDLLTISFP